MAGNKKTLSTVFKAVDQFSTVAAKVASAGEKATQKLKTLEQQTKQKISAPGLETTADKIANSFGKAEKNVSTSVKTMNINIEKGLSGGKITITDTADKLDDLGDAFEAVSDEAKELGNTADKSGKRVKGLGDDAGKSRKEIEGLGDGADKAKNKINNMGTTAEKALALVKGAVAAIGIAKAVDTVLDYGFDSQEKYTEFQKGTSEVKTLLAGSSAQQLAAVDTGTRQFAADNAMLTSEVTPALYNAISAGVSQESAFDFLKSSNELAVGGVAELNDSVAVLTTITNNYKKQGLEAATAADLLFTTVKKGVTTIPELASSLGEVVPAASASGVAFKDVTAGMATLTASLGAGSTAKATTKFRSMLDELSTTGSEVDKTFRSIAGKGFNEFIAQGGTLQGALSKLSDYADKNNVSIKELFSSVEAGGAALILGSTGAETFSQNIDAMANSAGAATEAYRTMQQTDDYLNKQLASKMESMSLNVGEEMAAATRPLKETIIENMPMIENIVTNFFSLVSSGIESINVSAPAVLSHINSGLELINNNGGKVKTLLGGIVGMLIASKTIKGISTITGGISDFLFMSGKLPAISSGLATASLGIESIALPLTLAAGAIAAVVVGVKAYDKWAREKSIEEHFGDITLSVSEMEDMANKVVANGNMDKIRNTLSEFEKLDNAKDNINNITSELDKLNWKVGLGIELTADENESYKTDIDNYLKSVSDYIEQNHYSTTLAIDMLFTNDTETGKAITDKLNSFYDSKKTELETLGGKLRDAVNDAYKDGLLTFDEVEKINEIRSQIAKVEASIAEDKLKGGLAGATADYSYKELTLDSAKEYSDTIKSFTDEAIDAATQSRDLALSKSALSQADKDAINLNFLATKGSYIAQSTTEANRMINDTYAEELSEGYGRWQQINLSKAYQAPTELFNTGDTAKAYQELLFEIGQSSSNLGAAFTTSFKDSDRKVAAELFEQMKPEREDLIDISKSYIDAGKTIPESIRKGVLDNAKVGMAIGDIDSLYTLIAYRSSLDNPEFVNIIKNAQASGQYIPDYIRLGVELATPNALSAIETETNKLVTGAVNEIDNGQGQLNSGGQRMGEYIAQGAEAGFNSASSKILQRASQFVASISNMLSFSTDITTKSDGTTSTFGTEVENMLKPKFSATGGIFDSPTLTWVAEAGDREAIIPLNDTQRAFDLWQETGLAIGAMKDTKAALSSFSGGQSEPVSSQKSITIKLEGGGEIKIPKSLSKQEVYDMLVNNIKPILLDIISQELFEGGDEQFAI